MMLLKWCGVHAPVEGEAGGGHVRALRKYDAAHELKDVHLHQEFAIPPGLQQLLPGRELVPEDDVAFVEELAFGHPARPQILRQIPRLPQRNMLLADTVRKDEAAFARRIERGY